MRLPSLVPAPAPRTLHATLGRLLLVRTVILALVGAMFVIGNTLGATLSSDRLELERPCAVRVVSDCP